MSESLLQQRDFDEMLKVWKTGQSLVAATERYSVN
jgi:hypothetical protein